MEKRVPERSRLPREGRLVGCYAPLSIIRGIEEWVGQNPERNQAMFIREAAREKLRREGIEFQEQAAA